MPTYEYVCRDCGRHLEVVQSFRDAPLTTCGTCGGVLRKVFSAAGIIFKGSGYYVTDSKADKRAGRDAPEKKTAESAGGESSPAAKSGASPKSGASSSEAGAAESA